MMDFVIGFLCKMAPKQLYSVYSGQSSIEVLDYALNYDVITV